MLQTELIALARIQTWFQLNDKRTTQWEGTRTSGGKVEWQLTECVDFGVLAKRHFVLNPNVSRRDCYAYSITGTNGGKHIALTLSLSQLKQCTSKPYAWVRTLRENLLILRVPSSNVYVFCAPTPGKMFSLPRSGSPSITTSQIHFRSVLTWSRKHSYSVPIASSICLKLKVLLVSAKFELVHMQYLWIQWNCFFKGNACSGHHSPVST